MSIPRRGYIAAGLAVAVVGSLGVTSTLDAGADEVPRTTPPAVAAFDTPVKPPALLPWGEKPTEPTKGPAGATSAQLAATGADIAPDARNGSAVGEPEYNPKGYTSRKRTLRQSRTTVPPKPPPTGQAPVAARDVRYHYASAEQDVVSQGSYANLYIARPRLGAKDYHSLAEIAVRSADGKQTIEVGWTVDRGVNEGSEDPHLFVYHWVNGQPTCYNACGFVQYSKTVAPGYVLPSGGSKWFGIERHNGVWWVVYDSVFVGYFPEKLWTPAFTQTGKVQWFGEVASSTSRPCTEMGTGREATASGAARIGSIQLVGDLRVDYTPPDRSTMVYTFQEVYQPLPSAPSSGPPQERITTTFRYGGPGFRDETDELHPSC